MIVAGCPSEGRGTRHIDVGARERATTGTWPAPSAELVRLGMAVAWRQIEAEAVTTNVMIRSVFRTVLPPLACVLFLQGACSDGGFSSSDNREEVGGRSGSAGSSDGGAGGATSEASNGGRSGTLSGKEGADTGGEAGESGEVGTTNAGSGRGGSAGAGPQGGSDAGGVGGRGAMGGAGNGGASGGTGATGGGSGSGGHAGTNLSGAGGGGGAGGASGGGGGGASGGGAGGASGGGGDAPCLARPTGLVSFWPGDSNANDVQDGNTGVLENGTTFASGKVLAGFFLDGVDDWVDVGNALNLRVSSGDFTVDAWVSFRSTLRMSGVGTAPPGDMSIVDKMNPSAINADGWRLLKQNDGHFWFCFGAVTNGCSGGLSTTVRSSTVITNANLNNWFHVAATKAGTAASIYVNGVLEGSTTLAGLVDSGGADLVFGTNQADGAFLNGQLDEVHLFHRALGASEIFAIYSAGAKGLCKP